MIAFATLFTTLLAFATILVGADSPDEEGCPRTVSRADWNAEEPKTTTNFHHLPEFVAICHTVTPECRDEASCSARVRSMQSYHMSRLHYDDIGYNFIIGEDGNVYEGRGWNLVGTQTGDYNNRTMGIAFIGNFREHVPDSIALVAAQKLIKCGVLEGKIPSDYKLVGHNQLRETISPGEKLFEEIKTWPGWTPNLNKAWTDNNIQTDDE